MCRTSSPPRRDLYDLEQTLSTVPTKSATDNGGFLLPGQRPRLTVSSWTSGRVCVYNANYASNGERFLELRRPWTVVTPSAFRAFYTHAEALAYAFTPDDPTPQEQSSVTAGWAPKYDHGDAWQEKWKLTR